MLKVIERFNGKEWVKQEDRLPAPVAELIARCYPAVYRMPPRNPGMVWPAPPFRHPLEDYR